MAAHCRIFAWRIPWIEESGRLQPIGSQRVRHDRATKTITAYLAAPGLGQGTQDLPSLFWHVGCSSLTRG